MNKRAEGWDDDSLTYRTFFKEARFSSREEGKKTFFEKIKEKFVSLGSAE